MYNEIENIIINKHNNSRYKTVKQTEKLLSEEERKYLLNKYNVNIFEALYMLINNISNVPKCPICGNKLQYIINIGYKKYCSRSCAAQSCQEKRIKTYKEKYGVISPFQNKETREKIKQIIKDKYGVDNIAQHDEIKKKIKETVVKNNGGMGAASDSIREKMKQTCLKKYGVEHNFQMESCQINSHSEAAKQKQKETNLKRYGCVCSVNNKEIQQNIRKNNLEKYGVEWMSQREDLILIKNETKRKNHTFNTSKPEEEIYNKLLTKFNKDDIIRQFYDKEKYPFNCDFYIKSLKLFIEFQGTWTHGGHPFNKDDTDDILLLEKWKNGNGEFYKNAISTWTIRDVKKRKTAKENNLNWIEFFNMKEFDNWLNNINN